MRSTPDTLTLGERLFEQACAATGIRYRRFRIAKIAGHKRPDYKVNIRECGAIVEVKQLVPNAEERRAAAALAAGRMVGGRQTPGRA